MVLIQRIRRYLLRLLFGFDVSKLGAYVSLIETVNGRMDELEKLTTALGRTLLEVAKEVGPSGRRELMETTISSVNSHVSELTEIVEYHQVAFSKFIEGDEAGYIQLALSVASDREQDLN